MTGEVFLSPLDIVSKMVREDCPSEVRCTTCGLKGVEELGKLFRTVQLLHLHEVRVNCAVGESVRIIQNGLECTSFLDQILREFLHLSMGSYL